MFKAEFSDAIMAAIPLLIELLKYDKYEVGPFAVSTLGKLAENGELHPNAIATRLTAIQSQIS
jgi:hypothetical protein